MGVNNFNEPAVPVLTRKELVAEIPNFPFSFLGEVVVTGTTTYNWCL
jgi:hypothetical protein